MHADKNRNNLKVILNYALRKILKGEFPDEREGLKKRIMYRREE